MIRIVVLLILSLWTNQALFACDACGSRISGNGIGLSLDYRSNFVSIGWSLTPFSTNSEHSAATKDYFYTTEISVRYHLTSRFKILLRQPYSFNIRTTEKETHSINGLSDPQIMGNYNLIRNALIGEQTSLFWEVGTGLKLPIGKYKGDIYDDDLPENFNTGTGTWSYLFQSNLVLTKQNTGFVFSSTYQYNNPSRSDYQFGHQLSTQIQFFWEKALNNKLTLTPNLGVHTEWIVEDKYANGNQVSGTGGKGMYITTGLNLQKDKWLWSMSYAQPLANNYASGEVNPKGRFSCQLSYIF